MSVYPATCSFILGGASLWCLASDPVDHSCDYLHGRGRLLSAYHSFQHHRSCAATVRTSSLSGLFTRASQGLGLEVAGGREGREEGRVKGGREGLEGLEREKEKERERGEERDFNFYFFRLYLIAEKQNNGLNFLIGIANALIFVVIIVVMTTLLVILFKYRCYRVSAEASVEGESV